MVSQGRMGFRSKQGVWRPAEQPSTGSKVKPSATPPASGTKWRPTLPPPSTTSVKTYASVCKGNGPSSDAALQEMARDPGENRAMASQRNDNTQHGHDQTPVDTSVERFGDAGGSRIEDSSDLSVEENDLTSCMASVLHWLNNCTTVEAQRQESKSALMSLIEERAGVNITMCSAGELPTMRTPWHDRTHCPIKTVAVWSIQDRELCWTSENWRAELCSVENLLICSTVLRAGQQTACNKYLVMCYVSCFPADNVRYDCTADGKYYVISCPPSVLPLRFATIVPTQSQPRWRYEHTQVLPLPS